MYIVTLTNGSRFSLDVTAAGETRVVFDSDFARWVGRIGTAAASDMTKWKGEGPSTVCDMAECKGDSVRDRAQFIADRARPWETAVIADIRDASEPAWMPVFTSEQVQLFAACRRMGHGELQARVARGDEDGQLDLWTSTFEAFFAITRAKLGHDHTPLLSRETFQIIQQRKKRIAAVA